MFKFKFLVAGKDSRNYFKTDWGNAVPVSVQGFNAVEASNKIKQMMGDPYDSWDVRLQEVEEVGCE